MIDENPSIYTGVLYLALFFLFSDQSINSNQKKKVLGNTQQLQCNPMER